VFHDVMGVYTAPAIIGETQRKPYVNPRFGLFVQEKARIQKSFYLVAAAAELEILLSLGRQLLW
jgi:hypothetical protein